MNGLCLCQPPKFSLPIFLQFQFRQSFFSPKFCAIRYIVAGHGSLPSSLYTQNVSGIFILQYMHYQFRGLDCIGTHCPDLISCTTELCMSLVGCVKPITFSSHHLQLNCMEGLSRILLPVFCPICVYIGPYAYGTSHTRMGYPVRVWANIMSHTRMGVPYEYACMIIHSCTTYTPGIY